MWMGLEVRRPLGRPKGRRGTRTTPIKLESFRDTARWLIRGSVFTILVAAGARVVGLGLQVLLARTLGQQNYADYSYAFAWLGVVSVVGTVGMNTAALRFIAGYMAVSDWACVKGFVVRSMYVVVVASSFIAVAGSIVVIAAGTIRAELSRVLIVGAWAVPFSAVLLHLTAVLRALGKPVLASTIRLIVRPVALACVIACLWLVIRGEVQAGTAMVVEIGATGLALVVAGAAVRRVLGNRGADIRTEGTAEWLRVAIPLLGVGLMQLLMRHTDVIMLGVILGTETSGVYWPATRVALLVGFGVAAVDAVLPPLIARYHVQNNKADLQRLVTLAARGLFAFAVVGVGVILVARNLILEAFGPGFRQSAPALVILGVGELVRAMSGSVGFVLSMTGHHRLVVGTLAWATVAHLALCLVLIPAFGIIGAATATAVVLALSNGALAVRCWKTAGINPSVFGLNRRAG